MTLRDIIRNGSGRAGSGGAWRAITVRDSDGRDVCELWHHGTLMLRWNAERPSDPDVLDFSTGWGSVSDQGGMNTAFRALGLPYRMDRDRRGGGPRITELRRHPCGRITDPASGCWCPDCTLADIRALPTVGA